MTSLGFIYVIEDEIVVKTDSFMLPPGVLLSINIMRKQIKR